MKIKRKILTSDCVALSRIARLRGDKSICPPVLQGMLVPSATQGILYEHEIEGVAHPIAFCVWTKSKRNACLSVNAIHHHIEYDGVVLCQMMLGHIMRTLSPTYSSLVLDVDINDDELIAACHGMGFTNDSQVACAAGTWLEFRYGIRV